MKKLLFFLILLGLGLAGGAYWYKHSRAVTITEDTFTYAPIEYGSLIEAVSATGTLTPKEVVTVGCEVPGKVVQLYAKVNDVVEPGARLLKLDDEMALLKLRQAREAVTAAQSNIERAHAVQKAAQRGLDFQLELEKNTKGGFRTQKERYRAELEASKAAVKLAEVKKQEALTAVSLAQLTLDKTVVRVPNVEEFQAAEKVGEALRVKSLAKPKYTIIDRKVVLGQMIAPPATAQSAQLFTLATDLQQMEVHAQVAEGDIAKIKKGMPVTFTVSAYSEADRLFRGQVSQRKLMPNSIQGAVYYDVVNDVTNSIDPGTKEWRLNPGMTASVDIILREHKGVWKVPTTALNFQLDDYYQSPAARAKVAQWQQRPDRDDWKALWIWDSGRQSPWPVFVRISQSGSTESGIKDSQFNEVLEWEPGQEPKNHKEGPRVIINAPPARKPGLFESPTGLKMN